MKFFNKNALITGATGGIGREIAIQMSKLGVNLFLTSTSDKKLKSLKRTLFKNNKNINIFTFVCDMSFNKNIDKLYLSIKKQSTHIDFLINSAGIFVPKKLDKESFLEITQSFQINTIAPIYLSKLISKDMKKRKYGRIINIGSSSSYSGFKNSSIYCATKHALLGFSRSLHDELKSSNIRVISVSPGTVDTNMAKKIKNQNRKTYIDPIDISKIIVHILSYDDNMTIEEIRLSRIKIE